MKRKQKKLDSFFKRNVLPRTDDNVQDEVVVSETLNSGEERPIVVENETLEDPPIGSRVNDSSFLLVERDPGLRKPIWTFPHGKRDEIRRAYLRDGPLQVQLPNFPRTGGDPDHLRGFQLDWYSEFPWVEYSEAKDAAYCLPCYLFAEKPISQSGWARFITEGFRSWKKVRSRVKCSFRKHMGESSNSHHNDAVRKRDALLHQPQHINKAIEKQSSEEIKKNRLRVKASIDSARWLALQGAAFRGHDETLHSKNRGNFIELVEILSSYNEEVKSLVLDNAPKNAKYISSDIQKQILHVLAKKVRNKIFEEIGDSKFSIIVDEACDESKQMAIILRFVDTQGLIQERFFDVVHVSDTTSMTLHTSICLALSSHKFAIQNLRGQGYDGASNMRGEWNGLQALFLRDHPQAYYVHCMAHRLQLALVSAAKDVSAVHEFFLDLSLIVNVVNASSKRHDQLETVEAARIAQLVAGEEVATGTGANQMSTLQRAGDTRWSSHLNSISSVIRLYESSYRVLEDIKKDGYTPKTKGDARVALKRMSSFEFIFILLLLDDIFGTIDTLCRALQHKSQDIVNAMQLVEATKIVLKEMRDEDWDSFLAKVKKFCGDHGIIVPDFSAPHFEGRPCRQVDTITNEHHYHFDIFNAAIDVQIEELRSRFEEKVVDLLKLSSSLDPSNGYKAFNIDAICNLARKYYPLDFSDNEVKRLAFQLKPFHVSALKHPALANLSSVADLCRGLAESGKAKDFDLVDRLIRLVLTLPVSTASGERAFSAMKLVKTKLRSKMSDDFLADSLVIYIERDIVDTFSLDDILSDFIDLKERRVRLR